MLPFMFIPAGLNLVKNVGNIIQQYNDIAEQEKKLQKDKEYQDLLLDVVKQILNQNNFSSIYK